jgi:hypothetical protein
MAKLAESKIKFTFVTEGDKAYIATQKKVSKENKSLQKEIKKLTKQVNLHEGAIKNLKPAIEKTSTSTKKFGQACKKTAADQKILNKESDIAYRNNRNLLGSFSVLRSKLLLATFAMTALSGTVGRFVKESADVEETLNKFNVVFGKSSDRALEFSETLAEGVGRSKFMLQEMLATLQDTFVPLGFARDKSADLSMALTKLAVDVASFQNKADDEVVKAFTSALVGNHEAVRAYGITITQAMLQQAALEKGIIDTEREMTAQEKVLARLVIIYNATRDAEDDAIKTKESYTNQLKAFNAQLEELRVRIGDTIEPFAALLLKLAGHFANVGVLKGYALAISAVGLSFVAARIYAQGFNTTLKLTRIHLIRTGIGIAVVTLGELAARTIYADDTLKDFNDSIDGTIPSLDEMIEGMMGTRIEMEGMTRAIAFRELTELDAQIGDLHSDMGLFQGALEDLNNSFFVAPEGWTEEMKAGVDASLEQITALEAKVKAYEGYLKNTIDQELSFRDEVKKLGLSELEYKKYLLGKRVQAYRDAGVDEIVLNKLHTDSLAKLEVEAAEKTDKLRERQAEKLISTNLNISKLTDDRYTYEWKALSVKYEKEYALAEGNYDLQLALYQEYVERKRELDEEEGERKKQSEADVINQVISSYSGVATAYSQMVQGQLTEDINKLKSSSEYANASMEQREIMEEKIRKKYRSKQRDAANMEKAANVATSIMNTAAAVTKVIYNPILAGIVGTLGAAQTAIIMNTPTGYAEGGLVKGQGSDGDTVPAVLTPGEFVIKRSAVQKIGLENLFKINNIRSMAQSESRQMAERSLTKVANLATDLGGMTRKYPWNDWQTSGTVINGQEKGRYQYGGLVTMNNSLPMEDMREMTGVGTGNTYNINISAPLVDETVVDSIIPAIEKAQRLNLA